VVVTMGDCHLYSNHAEQVETQLARQPKARPVLEIVRKPESVYDYCFEDFVLQGYDPEPNISAPVAI
jgi:thymidylate synthase